MKLFLTTALIMLSFFSTVSSADELNHLTLSESEMQKLKQFFPDEESANLLWQGDPLSLSLPINKEKRIVFSETVSIDLKGALNTDQLRVINNDKSVYLTALKTFQKTRLFVTLQESGTVIMLDIFTKDNAIATTQYVEVKKDTSVSAENKEPILKNTNPITYVDLIRFSYQQLYAPERLLKNMSLYSRVPMHTRFFTSNLVYGDKVTAHPVASWSAGGYYVTAVALQNKYAHLAYINTHHDLCGDWQAATIYPRSILQSYGDKEHDSAILFLVSRKTFSEAIGVCYGDA